MYYSAVGMSDHTAKNEHTDYENFKNSRDFVCTRNCIAGFEVGRHVCRALPTTVCPLLFVTHGTKYKQITKTTNHTFEFESTATFAGCILSRKLSEYIGL